jgi:hypothetical protein
LFAGFKRNTGDLVLLGVLTVARLDTRADTAVLIAGGGAFMSMMMGGEPIAHVGAMGLSFFLALLVVLALAVPLYMALWFAPSLIVFNQLKPVDAMKTSFYACLKNIVPFLIYGVIAVMLCLIAAIPFGLRFLVLDPSVRFDIHGLSRYLHRGLTGRASPKCVGLLSPLFRADRRRRSRVLIDASTLTFGAGCLREANDRARALGLKRVAIYTDAGVRKLPPLATVTASLKTAGSITRYTTKCGSSRPTPHSKRPRSLRSTAFDGFSVGGGSVIDTCKAANLYSTYPAF